MVMSGIVKTVDDSGCDCFVLRILCLARNSFVPCQSESPSARPADATRGAWKNVGPCRGPRVFGVLVRTSFAFAWQFCSSWSRRSGFAAFAFAARRHTRHWGWAGWAGWALCQRPPNAKQWPWCHGCPSVGCRCSPSWTTWTVP